MDVINTVGLVVGVVASTLFLLAGGVLLPLWEMSEGRGRKPKART